MAHGRGGRSIKPPIKPGELMRNRPLLIFAGCLLLFHLANRRDAAADGQRRDHAFGQWATLFIAACIVVPQLVVAALSPWFGNAQQIWGRRPLLLIGFAALPIRGMLFALVTQSVCCWSPCSCSTASPRRSSP